MKILQVNCVYNTGSTGKIVYDIHNELLRQGIESVVCYGRGTKITEPNVYKVCSEPYSKINNLLSRFTGLMYGGCFFSTNYLISIIKKEHPDVVHLHCLNGYFVNIYRLINFLKKSGFKTVLTLHAEFMHTGNCGHAFECEKWKTGCGSCPRMRKETKAIFFDHTRSSWLKMKSAFEGFEDNLIIVSVSPWLMDRAKQSPILSDKHHSVVLNGIDTNVFKPQPFDEIKGRLGIRHEPVFVYVTANFDPTTDNPKGGKHIVTLANMLKIDGINAKIIIAANRGVSHNLPDNIIYLGQINNQLDLAQLYSMADLTVLTSMRETFSMPVVESLCCGTPVVGFLSGGSEQISISEFSAFVENGDVKSLKEKIIEILRQPKYCKAIATEAQYRYSKELMCSNYLTIYKNIVGVKET
jgi:Glycosyltransferase